MVIGGFTAIAVLLASQGRAVLPVSSTKVPVIRSPHRRGHGCHGECGRDGHGVHDATTDPAVIAAWGRDYPHAQPAVACGPSGLLVVDVDSDTGEATIAALEAVHGPLPATFEVTTGRGRHLWFAVPVDAALHTRPLPGVDLKAGASYVLAPGSRGRHGDYRVAAPRPVAPAPAWLAGLCGAAGVQSAAEQLQGDLVPAA